jgi:hypothetical protein
VGWSSGRVNTKDCKIGICCFIPTVKSIKKNKTAQSGETGNLEIVSGYVMKASPGTKISLHINMGDISYLF